MTCPGCGGANIHRSKRRSFTDKILAMFGRWPYRCQSCQNRFALRQRSLEKKKAQIAYRTHDEKPMAQVVVRADSHEQLDQILLTLSSALSSYNRKAAKPAKASNGTVYSGD